MNPAFATPDSRPGSPSYDPGFAVELDRKDWSLNGVYMNVDNEIGNGLDYVGIQAAYHRTGPSAPGNYRILAYSAAGRLKEPKRGSDDARMYGLGVSIDQELGDGWASSCGRSCRMTRRPSSTRKMCPGHQHQRRALGETR